VPLEGKFLLIVLVIVRITLNVLVRQMPQNVRYGELGERMIVFLKPNEHCSLHRHVGCFVTCCLNIN
jgi:hypothetical protein